VIHIVAERMEDLTPWLAELSEQAAALDTYIPADGVRHGASDPRERTADAVTRVKQGKAPALPDRDELAWRNREAMPKGRNFQ
jgi:error-prone DNA polymerase